MHRTNYQTMHVPTWSGVFAVQERVLALCPCVIIQILVMHLFEVRNWNSVTDTAPGGNKIINKLKKVWHKSKYTKRNHEQTIITKKIVPFTAFGQLSAGGKLSLLLLHSMVSCSIKLLLFLLHLVHMAQVRKVNTGLHCVL